MEFRNTTHLDTARLESMCRQSIAVWPHDGIRTAIRYSRGSDFSGTCFYRDSRIYVNLGRNNAYPYSIRTNAAPARTDGFRWWRDIYTVDARDGYELVLFVFLHEFYHWLIRQARRNVRQKEGRCDRFAVRTLVDHYGAVVRDSRGHAVERNAWDFQDLDGFVAPAWQIRRRSLTSVRIAPTM